MHHKVEIEFLYWPLCSSHEKALKRLLKVLEEIKIPFKLKIISINSEDEALKHEFLGSPTIRVNGKDIDETDVNKGYGLTCRLYKTGEDVLPLPTEEYLKARILQILGEVKNE